MTLREYRPSDLGAMAALFYETVHAVCAADYTKEQLDAWAPGTVDEAAWDASFRAHYSLVAVEGERIVGFGDMDPTGYLDRLYVHRDYQRRGVATALCGALEKAARGEITVHASLTARPFFEKRGYTVVRRQEVVRRGVRIPNLVMVRPAAERAR